MKVKALPAVVLAGALTAKCVAAAGDTVTPALAVRAAFTVSVAVIVWAPAVTRVTPLVKVCAPVSPDVNV
jgi:hypothetical protein